METGFFDLALQHDGTVRSTLLAGPPEIAARMRFNDGAATGRGATGVAPW
jgi:hypothetical protein